MDSCSASMVSALAATSVQYLWLLEITNAVSYKPLEIKSIVKLTQFLWIKFFTKGSGIEKWVYDGTNQNAININNGLFQAMFWSNNVTLPLLSYSIQNALERLPVDDT